MRFTLIQIAPGACPPAMVRAQNSYRHGNDYSLDQAAGLGVTKDGVFWFLIHLALTNPTVAARLVVWAEQLGVAPPEDNRPELWGNAKVKWQVARAQRLHVEGASRDVARAQALQEAYDMLLEVFRA